MCSCVRKRMMYVCILVSLFDPGFPVSTIIYHMIKKNKLYQCDWNFINFDEIKYFSFVKNVFIR